MTTGVAVAIISIITAALWLGVEAWAAHTGRPLITTKVREWNRKTDGLIALIFGLVVGILAGHFFFCAFTGILPQ